MIFDSEHFINKNLVTVDEVSLPSFAMAGIRADVLRLDKIDPVISGNKWFKLRYYLEEAVRNQAPGVFTLGGAWSNHLAAVAAAAKKAGLRSAAFVRGEKTVLLSPTLISAGSLGMELNWLSRDTYRKINLEENIPPLPGKYSDYLYIPEGGRGEMGIEGSKEIIDLVQPGDYTDLICAVGTGTMLSGFVRSDFPGRITGISVLKIADPQHSGFGELLKEWQKMKQVNLNFDYHFGGYAKKTPELIAFMNRLYGDTGISTDFVYTAKLFYAVNELAVKHYFPPGSRLLIIHSGGLQGNASLLPGTLQFPA